MSGTQHESKTKLLEATLKVVRAKGYTATRIEDVCAEAGLTKGSFFHHFKSKEDLALGAAAHWQARTSEFFATAPYHQPSDPRDRLLAYIEFRRSLLTGELPEFTCFVGTVIQEAYRTHPEVSAACEKSISGHAETLEADIRAAMRKYAVRSNCTAKSSGAARAGGRSRRIHPRQGEGDRRRCGGELGSPAALPRTAVS